MIVSRYQMRIVKIGVNLLEQMKFSRKSSKINFIISAVSNRIDVLVNLPEEHKEDIQREIKILEAVNDDEFLESCVLGNKHIYGGETNTKKQHYQLRENLLVTWLLIVEGVMQRCAIRNRYLSVLC